MPLSLQRPHRSVFAHLKTQGGTPQESMQETIQAPIQETLPEPTDLSDFFRFYPLTSETREHQNQSRRTKQVNPLPLSRQETAHKEEGFPTYTPHRPQKNHLRQNPMLNQPTTPTMQHRHSVHNTPATMPHAPHNKPSHSPGLQSTPPHMPPPSMQSHSPTQQAAQPTPENAAEHFRRVNKSLPDGVMYEPLDEDIIRLLKENGHLSKSQPPQQNTAPPQQPVLPTQQTAPPPATSTPPPATHHPEKITTALQKLTQDEQNAHIFYSGVAQNAPTDGIKKALTDMAGDCRTRLAQYIQILQTQFNITFIPEIKDINTAIPFEKAISLAITEESKALTNLGELLDYAEDTSLERQIQRILSKKVVAHQILLYIRSEIH